MAKVKRRKLAWVASTSSQVVGYKLYWSENRKVNYDSQCIMLGNVTEITLPDNVESFKPNSGSIEFAITAVDELGNESDMITLMAPYQFNVPQAPEDLYMINADGFHMTHQPEEDEDEDEDADFFQTRFQDLGSDENAETLKKAVS
jgi:hypothetical protein